MTADVQTRLADLPGALVEPKGLTTSIHYRNVPPEHWDDLARIVHEAVGTDATQFVLTTGHSVWEIRPRVAWHKGQAIRWVLQHLKDPVGRLVLYLGDDRTDEDAFACLPDGITVKVGSPESPTEACYGLPDPDSVHAFLVWLVGRLAHRFGLPSTLPAAMGCSGSMRGLSP